MALSRFSQMHKLVRVLRPQKPGSLSLSKTQPNLWTGLAVVDGQVFFTLEKKGQTWEIRDLTIPLTSQEVMASGRRQFVSEKDAWLQGSADFAEEIAARGLVPYKISWMRLASHPRHGVELIYKHPKNAASKLRLIYRTSDLSLVLYSKDPDGSPIKGLSFPGTMPRHIEAIDVKNDEESESSPFPTLAQISSTGVCLAGLGAIAFLLISSVTQSIKVQRLIQK
ncbi:hypothetical protein [Aphanizomenon phage Yong-DA]|nr:hypothetical protein [Aphanizomenon phage Yong-DA]